MSMEQTCFWQDEQCVADCESLGISQQDCSMHPSCMFKQSRCMRSCSLLQAQSSCLTNTHCNWRNNTCEEACPEVSDVASCNALRQCTWNAGAEQCQEACWTFDGSEQCASNAQCFWDNSSASCSVRCEARQDAQDCPEALGCIWDTEQMKCHPDICSALGNDCFETQCCSRLHSAGGMACYALVSVDGSRATCRASCTGTDVDGTHGQNCTQLGSRSHFKDLCAWEGEDCDRTGFCCDPGHGCISQGDGRKVCALVAAGLIGDLPRREGREVGHEAAKQLNKHQATPILQLATVTFYCFTALLAGSPEEKHLMKLASNNQAGIFACEGTDTFDTHEPKTGFKDIWEEVLKRGRYLFYHWTLKVDVDAIMVPDRMRQHLASAPFGEPLYIKNTKLNSVPTMNGSVVTLSRTAVQMYFDNKAGCDLYVPVTEEPEFLRRCLDSLGASYMVDALLLGPSRGGLDCSDPRRAAYHPVKDLVSWQCCFDIMSGNYHAFSKDFRCQLGYSLDFDPTPPPLV